MLTLGSAVMALPLQGLSRPSKHFRYAGSCAHLGIPSKNLPSLVDIGNENALVAKARRETFIRKFDVAYVFKYREKF